jgi:hypothetical protein
MVNQQLIDYFKKGMTQGVSFVQLKKNLLDLGWPVGDVQEALDIALGKRPIRKSMNILEKRPVVNNEEVLDGSTKKVFLIGMAVIAIIAIIVVFVYIDGKKDIEKIDSEAQREVDNLFREESKLSCIQDWECEEWGECLNNVTSRVCYDLNDCNDESDIPVLEKDCVVEEATLGCVENWTCGEWGNCTDGVEKMSCVDDAECGTILEKPVDERDCVDDGDLNESSVVSSAEEACVAKNKNSHHYGDSMVCVSNLVDDVFDVDFDGEMISCCIGDVVGTPEEACAVDDEVYFNSSYDCTMFSTMDFDGTDINCCKKTPFSKYVIDSELSNSWRAMSSEENCSINLSSKLSECAEYRCSFEHPFGGVYEKGIVFEKENLCYYYEEMPNNGVYLCQYNSTNLAGSVSYWDTVYTTGEYDDDFANEMLDLGICQILGYD